MTAPAHILIVTEGREAREIPGYPGYYVTRDGLIISEHYGQRCRARPLKPGYANGVSLYRNGRKKTFYVHQIINRTYKEKGND
jgi:hypothetical protein